MSDFYVYSTLTASVSYMIGEDQFVLIAGGANVPDKYMLTSAGVVTPVTTAQLDGLKALPLFQQHHKNGFIRWESKRHDVEKVVVDMFRSWREPIAGQMAKRRPPRTTFASRHQPRNR